MSLTLLESQPSFPYEDISESSADMLELLLSNNTLFRSSHEAAEGGRSLYKLGHGALTEVTAPILDDTARLQAFSYGISAYENIGGLMHALPEETDDQTDLERILAMAAALKGNFLSTAGDAREQFSDQLPNAAYVISQTALRQYASYTDYVLTGAAVAASLERGDITL